MSSRHLNSNARLDPEQVLSQAQRIDLAQQSLASEWIWPLKNPEEWESSVRKLRRRMLEQQNAAEELRRQETAVRRALEDQNLVVNECLVAAQKAFPQHTRRIDLVNRAFKNAGPLHQLQFRAVSWEQIWETLNPEWEPAPGVTLHSFRQHRVDLGKRLGVVCASSNAWRMATELCHSVALELNQQCFAWATEAQKVFPNGTMAGKLVSDAIRYAHASPGMHPS